MSSEHAKEKGSLNLRESDHCAVSSDWRPRVSRGKEVLDRHQPESERCLVYWLPLPSLDCLPRLSEEHQTTVGSPGEVMMVEMKAQTAAGLLWP